MSKPYTELTGHQIVFIVVVILGTYLFLQLIFWLLRRRSIESWLTQSSNGSPSVTIRCHYASGAPPFSCFLHCDHKFKTVRADGFGNSSKEAFTAALANIEKTIGDWK